ncbi:MAG: cytochrome b [Alphaproteobacteria bacterium]|nr:cytochrome b [Alphaproteobacteria bacterium]
MKTHNDCTAKYPLSLRILHWVIGIMMIGMLIVGFVMADYVQPPLKYTLFDMHKATGLTIFGLTLARIALRLVASTPPLPSTVAWYERVLAKSTYLALYGVMLAFPISGYVMSSAGGYPISWFGMINVPLFIAKNPELSHTAKELHETFGYVLAVLILLHFAGFLKHLFIDKENLLKRMW